MSSRIRLVLAVAVALLGVLAASAAGSDELVWANLDSSGGPSSIGFASLDGLAGGKLPLPAAAPLASPLGLTIDSLTGRFF